MTSWTDNQSLIDKVSKMLKWKVHVPANAIESDWDALKTTVDTMQEFELDGTKVERKWVQGHQDKKVKCADLSTEAQMNCEADAEAHRHQREAGAVRNEAF